CAEHAGRADEIPLGRCRTRRHDPTRNRSIRRGRSCALARGHHQEQYQDRVSAAPRTSDLCFGPGPMEQLDLRLYAIVDPENTGGHDLIDLARAVAAGGATLVQLRDKMSDTAHMIEAARALKAALAPFGVPLIVNDRIDVAIAADAD